LKKKLTAKEARGRVGQSPTPAAPPPPGPHAVKALEKVDALEVEVLSLTHALVEQRTRLTTLRTDFAKLVGLIIAHPPSETFAAKARVLAKKYG